MTSLPSSPATPPATGSLDADAASFIEELGVLLAETGLPRSVGRVLGLLLMRNPQQQTAVDIQRQLSLSSGSVSTATGLLRKLGIIRHHTQSGSRRLSYEIDPDCWANITRIRLYQIQHGIKLADRGLVLRPNSQALLGMRHIYVESERLLRDLL